MVHKSLRAIDFKQIAITTSIVQVLRSYLEIVHLVHYIEELQTLILF